MEPIRLCGDLLYGICSVGNSWSCMCQRLVGPDKTGRKASYLGDWKAMHCAVCQITSDMTVSMDGRG